MKSIKSKLLILTLALLGGSVLTQAQSLFGDQKVCDNYEYTGKPTSFKKVHQKRIRIPIDFPNGHECVEIDFFARFQRHHTNKPGNYKVRLILKGETLKVWDSPSSTASLFCDGKTRIKVNNSNYDQLYLEVFDEYNVLPMDEVKDPGIPYVEIKFKTAE
ncbi:MAG: hypothetical protein R3A50_09905 [Saprospiraceae bacterium]